MALSLKNYQIKDPGLHRFQKTNLYFATDKYLLYQDPTWLGFKLMFLFNDNDSRLLANEPKSNTAYNYLLSIGDKPRALYLDKFVSHLKDINQKTPWFFQTISGLQEAWKRGYQDDDFKSALPKDRKIEIGCLESIDLRISALMDFYRKACFDWNFRREIVPWNLRTFTVYIYVYELRNINRTGKPSPSGSLDLSRLVGLPDVNEKQQKENAALLGDDPFGNSDNKSPLKQLVDKATTTFNDIKKAEGIKGIKSALSPDSGGNESSNSINENISRFLFKFDYCEFLPDESGSIFEKVSSVLGSEGEAAQQKITFSYRTVEEINLYNIYSGDQFLQDYIIQILDEAAKDNSSLTDNREVYANTGTGRRLEEKPSYGIADILNEKGFAAITPFASLAADRLERLISSYAGKLLLGNVYGFSPLNSANAVAGVLSGDPTQVVSGAQTLVNQAAGSKSEKNRTNDVNSIGNNFSDTQPSRSNTGGRVAVSSGGMVGSSLSNDNGPDSKTVDPANSQASKSNDNGPDSNYEEPNNPQASLSNG